MAELTEAIEKLGKSFDAYKATNDKRLAEIETTGHASAETTEKLAKIEADVSKFSGMKEEIEALEAKFNRPGGGGSGETNQAVEAHNKAFNKFMRTGQDAGLSELEHKAELSVGSDPDGGYLVADELDRNVTRILGDTVAMRGLAKVQPVGSTTYEKIKSLGGATSGWVGETETRTETDTPTTVVLAFPAHEMYAEPKSTQKLLDDSFTNVEQWLADELGIEFGETEATAFITGSGVKKPRGILAYDTVANASYAWGSVGYIPSGAAGGFAATNPSDELITLIHALKGPIRTNATWLTNNLTLAAMRKFKDGNGDYLWQPGLQVGVPSQLLGYPVAEDDNMPDMAANSLSLAFGDFNKAYLITDRMGVRTLRDPFTSKGFVKFYTTKRVGGGIQDFEAIKLMKFATS